MNKIIIDIKKNRKTYPKKFGVYTAITYSFGTQDIISVIIKSK